VPNDQISSAAAALVAASPDVIAAGPEFPLIGMTEDMVAEGLVASLARPGGNTTGISLLSPELDGKRQEILLETVPGLRKLAILADADVTKPAHLLELAAAAQRGGVEALIRKVAKRGDVIAAIKDVKASGAGGINFLASPMFSVDAVDVVAEVGNLRLASIYQWPEDAENGAPLAYGPRFTEMYRERAPLIVKVLRGARPSDIPVEQPTKFELVINLKTAKTMGVHVPSSLQLRANKVIE
jgi:putative ABC transport system substrate-binding protein